MTPPPFRHWHCPHCTNRLGARRQPWCNNPHHPQQIRRKGPVAMVADTPCAEIDNGTMEPTNEARTAANGTGLETKEVEVPPS